MIVFSSMFGRSSYVCNSNYSICKRIKQYFAFRFWPNLLFHFKKIVLKINVIPKIKLSIKIFSTKHVFLKTFFLNKLDLKKNLKIILNCAQKRHYWIWKQLYDLKNNFKHKLKCILKTQVKKAIYFYIRKKVGLVKKFKVYLKLKNIKKIF